MPMKTSLTWGAALVVTLSAPAMAQKAQAGARVSIQGDVAAGGKEEAAEGDKAFAAGNLRAALSAYGEGFADTKDPDFLYAMARVHKAMGHRAEAKSLFESYLAGAGELKYRSEASAEAGVKTARNEGGGLVGGVVNTVGGVATNTVAAVGGLAASVYTAVKVDLASRVEAGARAAARAGDQAYEAGKYAEAQAHYDEAYSRSQQALALFAEGMADAHAGLGAEARAELAGYLATRPKGEQAAQARQMLLALGGSADLVKSVAVSGKVSKEVKASAAQGDRAFAAGRFLDAAKFYGEAYARKGDAAALYAKAMAEYAEGDVKEAAQDFKTYLASSGRLEFKAQAQAALAACDQ